MPILTTRYEFAHGKKPRGCGCWMFTNDIHTIIIYNNLYSNACKVAKKELSGRIYVCP